MDVDVGGALVAQGLADEPAQSNVTRLNYGEGEKKIHKIFPFSFEKSFGKDLVGGDDEDKEGAKKSEKAMGKPKPSQKKKSVKVTTSATITAPEKENSLELDGTMRLRALKTEDGTLVPFGFSFDNEFTITGKIEFKGALNMNWEICDKSDILPKNLKIVIPDTPIVLKICCGLTITFDLEFAANFDLTYKIKGRTVHDHDVFDFLPSTNQLIRNLTKTLSCLSQWKLYKKDCTAELSNFHLTSDINTEFMLSPGIGLYTDDFSARFLIGAHWPISITSPSTYDETGYGFDISNSPGISGNFDLGFGARLTRAENFADVARKFLHQTGETIADLGEIWAYFGYSDDEVEEHNKFVKKLNKFKEFVDKLDTMEESVEIEKDKEDKDKDKDDQDKTEKEKKIDALSLEFFEWMRESSVIPEEKLPWKDIKVDAKWLPVTEDNSWHAIKNEGSVLDVMSGFYDVAWNIADPGIVSHFTPITPCLLITRERNTDYEFVKLFFYDWVIDKNFKHKKGISDVSFQIPFKELKDYQEEKLHFFRGYLVGKTSDLTYEQMDRLTKYGGKMYYAAAGLLFDKAEIVNNYLPPKIKINWIANYQTVDFNKFGLEYITHPIRRLFRVQYQVDHPERAALHGVFFTRCEDTNDEQYHVSGFPVEGRPNTFQAEIWQEVINSDVWLGVTPYTSRDNDIRNGFIVRQLGFHNDFEDSWMYELDGDKWKKKEIPSNLLKELLDSSPYPDE